MPMGESAQDALMPFFIREYPNTNTLFCAITLALLIFLKAITTTFRYIDANIDNNFTVSCYSNLPNTTHETDLVIMAYQVSEHNAFV